MMARGVVVGPILLGCAMTGCGDARGIDEPNAEPLTSASDAWARNALTASEADAVLKAIDDICGDTWCEGDFDYRFRRLRCSHGTQSCTLTLQLIPREGVPSERPSFWRTCQTPGFTGYASLLATWPTGYASLQPEYYQALTACIGALEDEVR